MIITFSVSLGHQHPCAHGLGTLGHRPHHVCRTWSAEPASSAWHLKSAYVVRVRLSCSNPPSDRHRQANLNKPGGFADGGRCSEGMCAETAEEADASKGPAKRCAPRRAAPGSRSAPAWRPADASHWQPRSHGMIQAASRSSGRTTRRPDPSIPKPQSSAERSALLRCRGR